MSPPAGRLRNVRVRLQLAVVGAVVIALTAATVGFNLLLVVANGHDADSLLRERAESIREDVLVRGGALQLAEKLAGEQLGS